MTYPQVTQLETRLREAAAQTELVRELREAKAPSARLRIRIRRARPCPAR